MDKSYEMDGYVLHLIPNKKFKNITISLKLVNELKKETTTIRTLLSFMLSSGTKDFPSTKLFSMHLEDMYGARFGSNIGSKGKASVLNLTTMCINEEFLPYQDELLIKQIKLLNDVLINPNVDNNKFDQKSFDIKKKELKERIRANADDKFSYSLDKLFEYMGETDYLSISNTGYLDEVDKISNEDLYNYLQICLKEDQKHVYVVGDIDDSIVDVFKQYMRFDSNNNSYESSLIFKTTKDEVLEIIEKQDVTQAKLNMGYTIDCDFLSEDHYNFTIFNALFGGFSQSRLFKVVREENSLCYYVSSSYDAFNGIMVINAGIEDKNYEKTKSLIQAELEKIKNGEFSEEDINIAKIMIENALNSTNDVPSSIIALTFNRDLTNKQESNKEYLEKLMAVTKEDIIKVSKKVKLDTIFLLTGSDV